MAEMKKKTRVLRLSDCMTACGNRSPVKSERKVSAMEYALAQGDIINIVTDRDEIYFLYK